MSQRDKNDSDSGHRFVPPEISPKNSEILFRTLAEQLPVEMVLLSPELKVLWANQAAADLAKKPIADLLGKLCYVVWGHGDKPCRDCPILKARQTKKPQFSIRETRGGRWWSMRGYPVLDDNGEVTALVEFVSDLTIQKRAKKELTKRDREFRELFNSTSEAIFIHDSVSGNTLDCNLTAVEMYGYASKKEIIGGTLVGLNSDSPPFDQEHARALIERATREGPITIEWRARKKNGEVFWVEVNVKKTEIGGMQRILVMVRDINEKKRDKEALKENRRRLQTLMDNLPGMAYRCLNDPKWTMNFVSGGCKRLTGYLPEELLNNSLLSFAEMIHPEDRREIWQEVQAAVKAERPFLLTYRIRTRLGGEKWVREQGQGVRDTDGNVSALEGFITDITDIYLAQDALRESEARFRQIYKHMSVGVARVTLDFTIQDANDAFRRMLGYREEELLGIHLRDITSSQDIDEDQRQETRLRKGEIDHFRTEKRFVHKDGGLVFGILDANLIRDSEGNPSYFLGTIVDISDRKQNDAERQRLREQFHRAQRLESVGRLAGGVAHDLNNLLTPILGYSEMLMEETNPGDYILEPAQEILNAGSRARDMVRQLLAFSRKQAMEFTPVDINSLLEDFRNLLRRTIREDISIRMELASDLPAINGDRGQLEQVVLNLAVNSQDAMPGGGELILETGITGPPEYALPGVRLTVRDNGMGMSSEIREHLFEPFFSTKPPDKGTGLGLSTVYGIIRQHRGEIQVESAPGRGTAMHLFFPGAARSARQRGKESKEEITSRGSGTVLVVEDSQPVRELTGTILKRNGYEVLTAANGPEALDALKLHEGSVDLLLTDVIMPGMNGRELFERVSREYPDTRALFMSGYADEVIARHGILEREMPFIQKPFSISGLINKVRETLQAPGNPQ